MATNTSATVSKVQLVNLRPGTVFRFKGKEYRTEFKKRVNYAIVSQNGEKYDLRMTAYVEVVENPTWGKDVPAVTVTATPYVPRLKEGTPVRITKQGQFYNKVGYVCKVNARTYGVVIPRFGVVNAGFGIVEEITED